ncbi:hypothetical protein FHX80_115280 [Streptomyces brevispora]|uniref:Uncharacterized protein n=1 Tax=Streptomyces brevispora TaxID=887462 RepID=A0A561V593_9ACTN|nr:hypothetical protein [Streptomyces brevispora]TWG06784.1 hypothetical protein FHX80_115280 [Streptomyces brevispora]
MGVLYGYFAASDDHDAVRAVDRDDEMPSGTGYDQLVVKGIDPVVELMTAEALVTGRSAAAVRSDPRHGSLVAMVGDGELVVVTLTDTIRDSLATCGAESLRDVATNWSGAEGSFAYPADPDDLAGFLAQLSELAGRAVTRGARLYCWICP